MARDRPTIVLFILCGIFCPLVRGDCSQSDYTRCVRIADPLVREAHLVFPDNVRDIETVCRTWNRFVECVGRYTERCFDERQRRQFNRAVEHPIESVHRMCSQPRYQEEYLRYAPCIKSTITETSHCGHQYNLLVEQVERGGAISKTTLCCSHDKFKECVQRETRRLCDGGLSDGPATRFSNQIMEKALSFLQEQCFNYIPNSADCATPTTDGLPYADPLSDTVSSEVYPWSTVQDAVQAKEMPSSQSWLPSSTVSQQSTAVLGSRTRPASYGRASSWSDTPSTSQNVPSGSNTLNVDSYSTPSSRVTWATTFHQVKSNSSTVNTQPFEESTKDDTAWYPAAGTSIENAVDEPNQQGLSFKPKNGAATQQVLSLTVAVTVITVFC